MPQVAPDVDRRRLGGERPGVLRPVLPGPGNLVAERLQRQILEKAEQVYDFVPLRPASGAIELPQLPNTIDVLP